MIIDTRFAYTTDEQGLVKNGLWLTNEESARIDGRYSCGGGYNLNLIYENLKELSMDEQKDFAHACKDMRANHRLLEVNYIYAGVYELVFGDRMITVGSRVLVYGTYHAVVTEIWKDIHYLVIGEGINSQYVKLEDLELEESENEYIYRC